MPLFGNTNTFTTYAFEPFCNVISNPPAGTTALSITTRTSGLPSSYLTINGSNTVTFATMNGGTEINAMGIGSQQFVITALGVSNVVLGTSSNNVTIFPGRFLDASGLPFIGSNNFPSFYAKETIDPPIRMVAPFVVGSRISTPALPPGLSFYPIDGGKSVYIGGTPLTTSPQTNYLIVAKQTGSNNVVSSTIPIVISNERIRTSPSEIVLSGLQIGTYIPTQVITSTGNGIFRYTWDSFPDGLYATDSLGNTVTSGFSPTNDISNTLNIVGVPTLLAATTFRDLGYSNGVTQNIRVERIDPLPVISGSVPITFRFGETVLFDPVPNPRIFTGVTISSNAIPYSARTWFSGNSSISTISSPDLRLDLSLSYPLVSNTAYLRQAATSSGSGSYTLRAANSNGKTRDATTTITVDDDIITFSGSTDTSLAYVLSRPSSLALPGYYPSPVTFIANASSQLPIVWSAPDLVGTGLSLAVSGNMATISGTPTKVTPSNTLEVTASAVGSPATATREVAFEILDDKFTFSTIPTINWLQNKAITPLQITATTTSTRPVITYSATGLPTGIAISTTGLLTGTIVGSGSGSFTVTASTGYSSGTHSFSFTLIPDSVLFFINPTTYSYVPGANVTMDVNGVAYSGKAVSNFAFSNFTQSYGLSINSTTGVISGTLSSNDTIPPYVPPFLPALSNFYVTAGVGQGSGSLPVQMTTVIPLNRAFVFRQNGAGSVLYTNDDDTFTSWQSQSVSAKWITDFQFKNTTLDSNVFLICAGSNILRSTNGVQFQSTVFRDSIRPYKLRYDSSSSKWRLAGASDDASVQKIVYYESSDDGITWNSVGAPGFLARQSAGIQNYYTRGGVAFGSSGSNIMLGGGYDAGIGSGLATMRRSDDAGRTWKDAIGGFAIEVGNFSVDGPVWVATGSSVYSSGNDDQTFNTAATTLKWSDDQGQTWSNATGDTFDVAGYDVAYASNTWLSTGMIRDTPLNVRTRLVCSTDGKVWSNVTLPIVFTVFESTHLPEIGSIWFDGSNWNVLVKKEVDNSCILYTHGLSTSLTSNWTVRATSLSPFAGQSNIVLTGLTQQYVRPGPLVSTFSFNVTGSTGPVITSPSQRSFLFYQYVTIAPITFTATGSAPFYYFVEASALPDGITFDPVTATLSGVSVALGSKSFAMYIQDSNGTTRIDITITTILPRIVRQQDGAGAYTSLVRQYTEVNAAETSRDNKALPSIEYRLGEFTSPTPPSVITATSEKCDC